MSETANIAAMAEKISEEIFKYFKWDISDFKDIDFECVNKEGHAKKKTHPSDVVFSYLDPYKNTRIYLNTDLKSFSANTISKQKVESALCSLAIAVSCACISGEWQEKFLNSQEERWEAHGLLFIYNHDNEYTGDFGKLYSDTASVDKILHDGVRLYVMGPKEILRLYNVAIDLKLLKADDVIGGPDSYTFFYPDLVLSKTHGNEWSHAATYDALFAGWTIIKYRTSKSKSGIGYLVYYFREGSEIDEFLYLIDALSHFQILSGDNEVHVRLYSASSGAINNFKKGCEKYLLSWGDDPGHKKRIGAIKINKMADMAKKFEANELPGDGNV